MRQTGGEIVLGVVEEWIQQEMCAVSSAKNNEKTLITSQSIIIAATCSTQLAIRSCLGSSVEGTRDSTSLDKSNLRAQAHASNNGPS